MKGKGSPIFYDKQKFECENSGTLTHTQATKAKKCEQTLQNLSLKKINKLTIQSVVTGDFNNPNEGRVVKECEAYLTKLCWYFEITKH